MISQVFLKTRNKKETNVYPKDTGVGKKNLEGQLHEFKPIKKTIVHTNFNSDLDCSSLFDSYLLKYIIAVLLKWGSAEP